MLVFLLVARFAWRRSVADVTIGALSEGATALYKTAVQARADA